MNFYCNKIKSNYSNIRDKARDNRAGIASMVVGDRGVFDVGDDERNDEFARRWQAIEKLFRPILIRFLPNIRFGNRCAVVVDPIGDHRPAVILTGV